MKTECRISIKSWLPGTSSRLFSITWGQLKRTMQINVFLDGPLILKANVTVMLKANGAKTLYFMIKFTVFNNTWPQNIAGNCYQTVLVTFNTQWSIFNIKNVRVAKRRQSWTKFHFLSYEHNSFLIELWFGIIHRPALLIDCLFKAIKWINSFCLFSRLFYEDENVSKSG